MGAPQQVQLATKVVYSGDLQKLRKRLSMSRTTMAALMGVSPESLKRWESGIQGMKVGTAIQIAQWWTKAEADEARFLDNGGDESSIVPIATFVSWLGVSQNTVIEWCKQGEVDYVDLGSLGYFVYRHELEHVMEQTQARKAAKGGRAQAEAA